jgi:hypothetical protein
MPARKSDTKPLHRKIQWGTLERYYQWCVREHRTPEGQLLYIMEEHRKEDPGVLILPASTMQESWRVWLKEEAEQQKIPEAELLGKCMTSYLEGLMSRQIGGEKR